MQIRKQLLCVCMLTIIFVSGCSRQESATNNYKMNQNVKESLEGDLEDASETIENSNELEKQEAEMTQDDIIKAEKLGETSLSGNSISNNGTNQAKNEIQTTLTGYNYNIEEDRKNFEPENIDIVVGDNYFATQINDWYMNFDSYDGKTVEIEGYYIDEFSPYLFVGRYGPVCPYCQGGYVSFEFYTDEDVSTLLSGKDWIKVTGILRKGKDDHGNFCYIEAISIVKMDKIGVETVAN